MTHDTELFDLCKKVYDALGWKDTNDHIFDLNAWPFVEEEKDYQVLPQETYPRKFLISPLYTSDYLLPILLSKTTVRLYINEALQFDLMYEPTKPDYDSYASDKPVKCLLKLTLKLLESGELNGVSRKDI